MQSPSNPAHHPDRIPVPALAMRCGAGPGQRRPASRAALLATALGLAAVPVAGTVLAEPVPQTMNGVPLLPIPTYEETGLPPFTMPTGATALDASTPAGGTTTGGDGSMGDATGTGSTGDGSGSQSMASMMGRSWGEAASQNAQTVGITPVALAATCQIEAGGCQTNPASSSTTITGTFQMLDSTYTAMMKSALARNPSLAANIVPGLAGKLDPATESIAAAEYLRQGAVSLQSNGVSSPSVLDVRGYYNFGPGAGAAIAQASPTAYMSDLVSLSASGYKGNGISPGVTTVSDWRAKVTGVIGASAASAPVLFAKS
jgi:hypothetical protein